MWWAQGEAALTQNWTTGDFETWIDHKIHLKAFGVMFRRADVQKMIPPPSIQKESSIIKPMGDKIFVGHGRSKEWLVLQEFLRYRLGLPVEEFNSSPTAGIMTAARLKEILNNAAFAFLVMTAEDERPDGGYNLNVVHEAGLFQGCLGFERAIILLEDGCEPFSNIDGLGQIRFPKEDISAKFEEVRRTLEREGLIAAPR
jgi:predicted nucleotide-binding protein